MVLVRRCADRHPEPLPGECRLCRSFVRTAAKGAGRGPPPASEIRSPARGGPGTEAKRMLAQLRVPACGSCNAWAAWMDRLGVEGCLARRAEIVARLESQAAKLGWWAKAKAGALALANGLPLTAEGLFGEAIRRAKADSGEAASHGV